MKKILLYIIFLLPMFSSCSKSTKVVSDLNKDSICFYISKAEDKKLSYQNRKHFSNRALFLLLKLPNDSINRENIFRISYNFFHLNEWESFKKVTEIGYRRTIEKNDKKHLAQAYRLLGIYHECISENDSAFYYYLKAEKLHKELNEIPKLCTIYQDKAIVQYFINDYLGSELSLTKALKISKDYNLIKEQYSIYKLIIYNSNGQRDYKKAIEYYGKAIEILKNSNFKSKRNEKADCMSIVAYSYFISGEIKKSNKIFEAALKMYNSEENNPLTLCYILDNYALTEFKLGNYKKLPGLYYKSAEIRNIYKIDQGKNYNRIYLSEYYATIKDTLKSVQYAKEAVALSKNFKAPTDILASLKQLIKVDPKNALQYSCQYINIADSMQLLERQTRDKFAKISYETEEITKEKESAVKKSRIISGVASGLILVLTLLFIIKIQRTKQKRLQLQQIQQKESEEIYNLLLDQQSKIDQARSIEKKRIAQDLHDGIMNRLASTRLNLQNNIETLTSETIKKCIPLIDGIQDIEKEIRNIAHNMNRGIFSTEGRLVAIIESFVEEQKRLSKHNYHLEIDVSIKWELIAGYKKIHIFRIIQEAIQNINKHAHAKSVILSILKKEEELLLEIFDDGIGFSLNKKKKGIGLQNIFSRAKSCHGIAEVKSKENVGTTIIVRIPI